MPKNNVINDGTKFVDIEVTIPWQGDLRTTMDAGTRLEHALHGKARKTAAGMSMEDGGRDICLQCTEADRTEVDQIIHNTAPAGTTIHVWKE